MSSLPRLWEQEQEVPRPIVSNLLFCTNYTKLQQLQQNISRTAPPVLRSEGNGFLIQTTIQEPEDVEMVLGLG